MNNRTRREYVKIVSTTQIRVSTLTIQSWELLVKGFAGSSKSFFNIIISETWEG